MLRWEEKILHALEESWIYRFGSEIPLDILDEIFEFGILCTEDDIVLVKPEMTIGMTLFFFGPQKLDGRTDGCYLTPDFTGEAGHRGIRARDSGPAATLSSMAQRYLFILNIILTLYYLKQILFLLHIEKNLHYDEVLMEK